ncbi:hypothetical protein HYV81_01250 [Candidatus Woesearchaeota archaeon]|nr:hypothetical protein [Candidatus Woesearchaeota archaeon]
MVESVGGGWSVMPRIDYSRPATQAPVYGLHNILAIPEPVTAAMPSGYNPGDTPFSPAAPSAAAQMYRKAASLIQQAYAFIVPQYHPQLSPAYR